MFNLKMLFNLQDMNFITITYEPPETTSKSQPPLQFAPHWLIYIFGVNWTKKLHKSWTFLLYVFELILSKPLI